MSGPEGHYCSHCKKNYSCRQNLNRHNKRFHPNDKKTSSEFTQKTPKSVKSSSEFTQFSSKITQKKNTFDCDYCNKQYSRKDNLKRHLIKCKEKDSIDAIKKENEILKKELLKLINKKCKIHPKTLEKMCRDNNITIDKSIMVNGNTINNNQQIQTNNINNNINILTFGFEGNEISKILSEKEKLKILNTGRSSLYNLVKHIHFNDDYPQFRNFAITNLNNQYAYKYNAKQQQFIACTKDELLEELIDMRILNIDEFYNYYQDKLDDNKKKAIEKLISDMEEGEGNKYTDMKHRFKFLVYNSTKNMEVE